MVAAMEMGMSEKEFWNSDPIFFNRCYEVYMKKEMRKIYVGRT